MDKIQMGKSIKELRMKKGLTQEQFGHLIDDATRTMVSKWERGITSPASNRQKILIEMGKNEGVDLYPSKDNDELRAIFVRGYKKIYDEYVALQLKESGERFTRLLNEIDEDDFMNEAIDNLLKQHSDEQLNSGEVENLLYDTLHQNFNRLINEHPQNDYEVINHIIREILRVEDSLHSYYYDDEGRAYKINDLEENTYSQIKSILNFAKFQLQNLESK